MFQVGRVNSPQIQFLTFFVCDQQMNIVIDFLLRAKQQPT